MPRLDHQTLLARQRCTAQFADMGVDPIGSAGSPPGGFVLFELPLPWPHDILELEVLADLGAVTKASRARPQALVPEPPGLHRRGRADGLRVIVYAPAAAGGDAAFRRFEDVAGGVDELAAVAAGLLDRAGDGEGDSAAAGAAAGDVLDVLVCTHGARDVCCGAIGSDLHARLRAAVDEGRAGEGPAPRLWRTSHTGGHRFAPTVLTFPGGLSWGWMADTSVVAAARGTLPVETAAAHLRGALGVRGGHAQTVDREAFRREGWAWLQAPRRVEVDEPVDGSDEATRRVAITGRGSGGDAVTYHGIVGVRREVPVPPCGVPVEEATKTDREYELLMFGP